jgi:ankyrin repeat protein
VARCPSRQDDHDGAGDSPLHSAALQGEQALVTALLDDGFDVNATDHVRQ